MMDFVFCTDKNYLKGYGVLMLSILRFAPPPSQEQLCFHILSDDLDNTDKAALQGIAARRENTEVIFYEPAKLLSKEVLEAIDVTLGAGAWVTRAAYYRILAADLLPQEVHRALYLDGDIVCAGSLNELFALDLQGRPVGMGIDIFTTRLSNYNRLDYPPEANYYNSGVILLDIDAWRKEDLSKTMIGWLDENASKCRYHDQDVINAVLHGRIFQLGFSCNVMPYHFYVFFWQQEEKNRYFASDTQFLLKEKWPALRAACESPRLVHAAGEVKPWHKESDNPFTPVWRYFYAKSPWQHESLKHIPARQRVRRQGRRALERLNLITPSIPYPEEAYMVARRVLDGLHKEDARGQ